MATSSTYIETVTANKLFRSILRVLGVLGIGAEPAPEDMTVIREATNFWLLQQNGRSSGARPGKMMWTRERGTLTLSTSSNTYSLAPSGGDLAIQIPSQIISILYRDSDGIDTRLDPMTHEEYEELTDKDVSARPRGYYYEKRLSDGKLYLDSTPDTADSLVITYKQPLEIITANTNEFDVDPSWYRLMKFEVALDAAVDFEISNESFSKIDSRAKDARNLMNSFFPNNEPVRFSPA